MRLPSVLFSCLFAAGCLNAFGQAVTSTHSGVVNYSEGSVLLDDQPLDQKLGSFTTMKDGSVLRTEKGRAEVLLTPGVVLRIDEESGIRMVSNELSDTRVEFLHGSAILDSNDATPPNNVTLTYKTFQLRFSKPGVYRMDSEPGVFQTYTGEAEIVADGQSPQTIDESHQFFFGIGMETKKYGDGTVDTFSEWARTRAEDLAADNKAANQSMPDPNDAGAGVFTMPAPSSPSYVTPGYGLSVSPMIVDNGFLGAYGPYYNPPFFNPFTVIYVVPRWYGRSPVYGTPPRRTGIPVFGSTRSGYPTGIGHAGGTGYPGSIGYRPAPMPLRLGVSTPIRTPAPAYSHPRPASPVMVHPAGPMMSVHHR